MWAYDHMGSMMNGWGSMMGEFMILWLVILAAIIAGVVWFLRSQPLGQRRSPGLETLEQRYARGEISREEYLQKKQDINNQQLA
jgi:putative membrane protein